MTHGVLGMAFVYLAAAVIGVPIAKRLGLGAVLGYLLAGVAIGPFVLGLVGREGHDVMHFAEFGVVMMLFMVGLELKPSLLWELRRPILGLGGLQVLGTTAVFTMAAAALGMPIHTSVALGMVLAMSSTAIVLQSLSEGGMLKTSGGQSSFSVLLFQDIAVIPILAAFPLLAPVKTETPGARPAWMQAVLIASAVTGLVLAGRYLVRPAFRWLALSRVREVFTAAALLLVVGIALLMLEVGLSPALGTFMAGVVLAESEYRHELESDIEPFKGLLLGVFFISVGAEIDFGYIVRHPLLIASLVLAVMTLKLGVLYAIGRVFRLERAARWIFAFALAQVGEFAFVLVSFGMERKVFTAEISTPLVAVVALSMLLTPPLFIALERVVLPALTGTREREADVITHTDDPVVIAGFGRFGQVTGRLLRANGVGTTILDLDPGIADLVGRLGIRVYYGDASRLELLHAAGCERAKLFILAIDDMEQALRVAETVRKHFPHLTILARARNRFDYYALLRAGVKHVYRETFGSSLEMGTQALRELGFRAHTAARRAQRWRQHEERSLAELNKLWGGDEATYFAAARRMLEEAGRLLKKDDSTGVRDGAWDNESLREAARAAQRED